MQQRPARQHSRFALSNWGMRRRLVALITVPTVAAVIFGGILVARAESNARAFSRVTQLAEVGSSVTKLAHAMEDERDMTAEFVAAGRPSGYLVTLRKQYAVTDAAAGNARALLDRIGTGYSAQTRVTAQTVLTRISDLQALRSVAASGHMPMLPLETGYSEAIADLFAFDDEIAQGSASSGLADSVRTLGSLSRMINDASQQRALLGAALVRGQITPDVMSALVAAQTQQATDEAAFQISATLGQQQAYTDTVSGSSVDQGQAMEQEAIDIGKVNRATMSSGAWNTDMVYTLGKMRDVEGNLMTSIISQSRALQRNATRSALITGAVTLLVLLLVLLFTTFVARSLIRPLRVLREDALDIAERRLPVMVRRLSEAGEAAEAIDIEPIGVTSGAEIGEVARAFDQVHREAVRLAADEALLRGNMNAMFVNLSRRSQSLVERQLSVIDSLEQGEQEPARLSSLFRLDHLATRMRRNSENLLVLAGHEVARRWSQPIPLVDVLRAAISEIEQYERVALSVQPGISVVGHAVNDVVHLVAELVENATAFSPENTQVRVSAQSLSSGGVLVDITDSGVGISEEELAQANWRLDNPPVIDVGVSRRMGLFVVGRLAARHGIRARLRHAPSGGLTALIWLPDTVAAREGTPLGRLRRFEMEEHWAGPSLSAPPVRGAGGAATIPQGFSMPQNTAAQAAAAARISGSGFSPPGPSQPAAGSPATGQGRAVSPGNAPGRRGPQTPQVPPAAASGRADEKGPAAQARPPDPDTGEASSPPASGSRVAGMAGAPGARMPGSSTPGEPVPGSGPGTSPDRPGAFTTAGTPPAAFAGGGISGITVPEPPRSGRDLRLPIFDSLESDWFRRGGMIPDEQERERVSWSSPADEGWQAAEAVAAPATGETTMAGLPRRVPRANLVPGSIGAEGTDAGGPSRSAEAARSRLASFQRGVRRARAAALSTEEPWDG